MVRLAEKVIKFIDKVEDWMLISMLAIMVILAVAQIFYRNIFGAGIIWADPLLRTLVLWVALSGAVVATRTDNHIRIDFFTRYFSEKFCSCIQRLVYMFAICICSLIAWHAVRFVHMDYEAGTIAFSGVPAWVTQLIIPIGFFMMAARYVLLFISPPKPKR